MKDLGSTRRSGHRYTLECEEEAARLKSGDLYGVFINTSKGLDVTPAVALTARPYKKPWTASEAISWMLDTKGVFDRDVLREFIDGVIRA